eukprot:TRINITY_DN23649_c0_g1_i1.p1 TRINITY_DN23649_c0_g1~~TRINITY_DN23649_c0_g1_i1.p1  ORF type:complete len:390 (+),score=110.48 TRINITY_DN23649_c0_g1_i1:72-1172(+)
MPLPAAALLDAAVRAVTFASRASVAAQRRLQTVGQQQKEDDSTVTAADYAVQAIVTLYLTSHPTCSGRPFRLIAEEDAEALSGAASRGLLTEVAGMVNDHFPFSEVGRRSPFREGDVRDALRLGRDAGGSDGAVWVLDPIDGTRGFLRGFQYAVCLGLLEDGSPRLGAVSCPRLPDDLRTDDDVGDGWVFAGDVTARWAGGARLPELDAGLRGGGDCRELMRTMAGGAARDVLCMSYHRNQGGHSGLAAECPSVKRMPIVRVDSMAKYCLIARGDVSVYLRGDRLELATPEGKENIWDHVAGYAVAVGSGAAVADLHGAPLDFRVGRQLTRNRGVIVARDAQALARLADEIRAVAAGPPPPKHPRL